MSARVTVRWLLVALTVLECWAAIPSKRHSLPNIENGWPLSDQDVGEEGDFLIQMPSCLAVRGVCALKTNCQEEFIHEGSDLCGEQEDTVCCLTRSAFEKHVLQLKSCADTGSVCAFEEDCPEEDRHSNPLLCGDQLGVTCCKISPDRHRRRAHSVQLSSCEAHGGICRQEEHCPGTDRLGNSDTCGDQPHITCCKASDTDKPILSSENTKKRAEDKNSFDLKYKRRGHSVQIESCEAQGGICKQKDHCPVDNRLGSFDSCGDNPFIACCELKSQQKRVAAEKRSPEMFRSFLEKKSVDIGPRRPNQLPATQCESKGGSCKQEGLCPEQDRLGSSDMCVDEPNVVCCVSSPNSLDSSDKIDKRRAHSVQLESCRAQYGMCTYVSNCPAEEQLAGDMCGGLANITCCHLPFLESAMSQGKQSADVVPENEASANGSDRIKKQGGAVPIQIRTCKAQGGVCKKKIECPQEDYIDASDICGNPYELIYTCCRVPNPSFGKRRAHSVQLESCRAQGGMCRQTEQCPDTDRLDSGSCGDLPYITCCKKTNDSLSPEAEPRSFRDEPILKVECLMRGGLCKRNVDCFPEDRYNNTELCGSQAEVSCCKRLPPRVGECSERGGECVPPSLCQNGPKDNFGKCSGGDVCCIWIT